MSLVMLRAFWQILFFSSSIYCGLWKKTFSFKYPRSKRSGAVKSGDREGHETCPNLRVKRPGNYLQQCISNTSAHLMDVILKINSSSCLSNGIEMYLNSWNTSFIHLISFYFIFKLNRCKSFTLYIHVPVNLCINKSLFLWRSRFCLWGL